MVFDARFKPSSEPYDASATHMKLNQAVRREDTCPGGGGGLPRLGSLPFAWGDTRDSATNAPWSPRPFPRCRSPRLFST